MNNRGWYGWSVEMLGLNTQSREIQGQMKRCHFLENVSPCHSNVKEFEASLCIWTGITDSCLLNTDLFLHNPSHTILACRMRGNYYLFWINSDLNFLLSLYATFKDFKHIPSSVSIARQFCKKETGVGESKKRRFTESNFRWSFFGNPWFVLPAWFSYEWCTPLSQLKGKLWTAASSVGFGDALCN